MPAWAVKLGLFLARGIAGDESIKKLAGFVVVFILLILLLLISLPALVIHIPLVTTENIGLFYQGSEEATQMTKTSHDPNGIIIPWEEVTAAWAVLHAQDFSDAGVKTVWDFAFNWAERHERVEVYTDSEGNTRTETINWYTLRDFTLVMDRTGFTPDQQEQARKYLFALREGGLKPPAGWKAKPLPGWAWPVPGCESADVISSGYGLRVHPVTHVPGMHHGVDIYAPEGAGVVVATEGTVQETGDDNNLGRYVVIRGGGYETLYGHLSDILVSSGERVKAGQAIGTVGNTGVSTNPHLHFEVRFASRIQNPLRYF